MSHAILNKWPYLFNLKECPFSGVTSSGRIWRKVPQSDAGSVTWWLTARQKRLGSSRKEAAQRSPLCWQPLLVLLFQLYPNYIQFTYKYANEVFKEMRFPPPPPVPIHSTGNLRAQSHCHHVNVTFNPRERWALINEIFTGAAEPL